ncbi:hypothetical protein NKOR_09850 [Candidatus Nitrosopumilus koreensis AR1]|uniref:Uncharacterized protein n=1 Tax=Candidatus Nitrosopumilus koreensis AR1 TaxID=1229908 RepID=K0BA04_9ARCH|nr:MULTISPECIES: hypothetical protein [Nitrosopumilus]AFS81815.1 hypothetical protein NKOR_09850 [Candidatus Nitrosopumilus koreensis AR1]
MKSGIIIAVIIGVIGLGVIAYSLGTEEFGSQEMINVPSENESVPEGKNLSINLKESIGVEANP